ncbi:hypothetical protein [Frateuria terrea]|uniref:hypothetical protein n=1 Tax=Frateuria terrea TaxID=529704 RepID=UPI0011133835|nr:hypothetical protein [Frateuria terrea]
MKMDPFQRLQRIADLSCAKDAKADHAAIHRVGCGRCGACEATLDKLAGLFVQRRNIHSELTPAAHENRWMTGMPQLHGTVAQARALSARTHAFTLQRCAMHQRESNLNPAGPALASERHDHYAPADFR